MINKIPSGGQNLAQKRVFTPLFRLHTALNAHYVTFFGNKVGSSKELAIPVRSILVTPYFRSRVLRMYAFARDWLPMTLAPTVRTFSF